MCTWSTTRKCVIHKYEACGPQIQCRLHCHKYKESVPPLKSVIYRYDVSDPLVYVTHNYKACHTATSIKCLIHKYTESGSQVWCVWSTNTKCVIYLWSVWSKSINFITYNHRMCHTATATSMIKSVIQRSMKCVIHNYKVCHTTTSIKCDMIQNYQESDQQL